MHRHDWEVLIFLILFFVILLILVITVPQGAT